MLRLRRIIIIGALILIILIVTLFVIFFKINQQTPVRGYLVEYPLYLVFCSSIINHCEREEQTGCELNEKSRFLYFRL